MSNGSNASIDAATRFCAVFGHPIRHSASPAMQNAGLSALKLNWRYLACDVHPDNLRAAIDGARSMGFIGLNLTVPHKLLALEMVDLLDSRAREWGAVNTIVFEGLDTQGRWLPLGQFGDSEPTRIRSHGFNTDADAIIQSIHEDFQWGNLRGASVLLSGAGGAARAVALRLAQEQIGQLWLVNRTAENAQDLAALVAQRQPQFSVRVGYPSQGVDLAINATSVGLKSGDGLSINGEWLKTHRPARVYDLIYRPRETLLLRTARALGCQVANGLGMLLYQGAEALRLWTGQPPPVTVMREALEKNIHD